jgi:flagellar biosynthetic protein FliQ
MNQDTVVSLATQAMTLALKVAGPMLLAGLVIGLVVSIFQAVTSIQEQSLTFIPKIVGYAQNLYMSIPQLVG